MPPTLSNHLRRDRDHPLPSRSSSRRPALHAWVLVVLAIAMSVAAVRPPVAGAVQITEFPLESGSQPNYITTGSDGNLWFTDEGLNKIGRITTSGQVTDFGLGITPQAGLFGIAGGPEGNIWFTERTGHQLGRITTQGTITEISSGLKGEPEIYGITTGPEGNMWFTEINKSVIGNINPSTAQITEYPGAGSVAMKIVSGPDGNLWYVLAKKAAIVRMTPAGVFTSYPLSWGSAYPESITTGSEGDLWFNENHGNAIGRITPDGDIT
jgi:streptogramin lyase